MLSSTGSSDSSTPSPARSTEGLVVALHALAVVLELGLEALQVVEVLVAFGQRGAQLAGRRRGARWPGGRGPRRTRLGGGRLDGVRRPRRGGSALARRYGGVGSLVRRRCARPLLAAA